MDESNLINMENLRTKPPAEAVAAKKTYPIGKTSAEARVFETELHYTESQKIVDGLVQKEFYYSDDVGKEKERLKDVLNQWRVIKSKMEQRKKKGLPVFNLPNTVRGYQDTHGSGILMTDLSRKGTVKICDLKDIGNKFEQLNLTLDDWDDILEQVERDMNIAREENILLGSGGGYKLDPWLIAMEESGPKAYVVDIGRYTSVNPNEKLFELNDYKTREAIKGLDEAMQNFLYGMRRENIPKK